MNKQENKDQLSKLKQQIKKDMMALRKKSMSLVELMIENKEISEYNIGKATQILSSINYLIEHLQNITA